MKKLNQLDPICKAYAMSLLLGKYFASYQELNNSPLDTRLTAAAQRNQVQVLTLLYDLAEENDSKFWFNVTRYLFLKKSEILLCLKTVPNLQTGPMFLTAFKLRPFHGNRISREAAVLAAWRTKTMPAIIMFKLSLQDEDLPVMYRI